MPSNPDDLLIFNTHISTFKFFYWFDLAHPPHDLAQGGLQGHKETQNIDKTVEAKIKNDGVSKNSVMLRGPMGLPAAKKAKIEI